jgi:hypothetical protein
MPLNNFFHVLPVLLLPVVITAAEPLPKNRLIPVPAGHAVVANDSFWSPKIIMWRNVTIPHCFANFESVGLLRISTPSARAKSKRNTKDFHGPTDWFTR